MPEEYIYKSFSSHTEPDTYVEQYVSFQCCY